MGTQYKTVAFHTLGCKLNFSETSTISRDFIKYGFKKVDYKDKADIYVLNTCSVTSNADKEARRLIRSAKSRNRNASIVVIGCYAQLNPEEIAIMDDVDLVLGIEDKFQIVDYLDRLDLNKNPIVIHDEINHINKFEPSYSLGERTRSYLKIQDGCDYTCSFCTIPLARGKSRSDSIKNTMKVAQKIANKGIKEIVLTGVNVGDFGNGSNESLLDLLKHLDRLKGISRLRISSIEPNLLSDEIIEFCNSSKLIMPHYHIPLQSGSDKILRLMRRRYDRLLYQTKINKIKSINPDACIGADVIVGFPGETEEDFSDTYNFINDLDVSYLHVFTYSERNNTSAIAFSNSVSKNERSKRSKALHILSDKKRIKFYSNYLKTNRNVLYENEMNGYLFGHTDNYIKVKVKGSKDHINSVKKTNLFKINNKNVIGFI